MINTKLLAEICEVAGAPGHEQRVREVVLREVQYGRPWCPVIDPVTSVIKVLQTLNKKDISIFTPYTKRTHKSIVNFFTENKEKAIQNYYQSIFVGNFL